MQQAALSLFTPADAANGSSNVVALGPNAGQGLTKHTSPNGAAQQVLLGHLLWSSVSDAVRLKPAVLTTVLTEASLEPKGLLPHAPAAPSALTRAAAAAEVCRQRITEDRHGNALEDEHYVNVLFRSAARGVKQVVTEVLDASQNRLFYQPLASVELVRGDLHIRKIADGALLDAETDSISNLRAYYEFEKGRHDGEAVRRILGKVLTRAKAIPLRNSGGMYFVPRENEVQVEKMISFVDLVRERAEDAPSRSARPSRATSVPLVDTVEYRAVLADSLEEHVRKEASSLIAEMGRLLKGEAAVGTKRQRGYIERVRRLKESVASYEELLEIRATEARANLDLAMKEAVALLDTDTAKDSSTDASTDTSG